ncbi:hypothetical protein SARC_08982 [Sphaeroforma arctica JP610]|uniref:Nucleotide-diphospho-sugar transferase domain-containing protein n=1 Tax=Sphaeroforma arctica JP610 TaxID=667725 RepID=A0A0L0FPG2_9EUKA|nr:hypothetical protein SARC_08982 [Sphaeroforma arctica JP610]KNC78594.1 hypothetical protein SARC_08982 [Sphaeroforma arctica JP610]|eukprot:XP_014152496.1 hypothetical protein SARC_08982 [Sphaeroforma arctica JP610]
MSTLMNSRGFQLVIGGALCLMGLLIVFVLLEGDGGAAKRASQEYFESSQAYLATLDFPSFRSGSSGAADSAADIEANVMTCSERNDIEHWGCEVRDVECCRSHRHCSEEMEKCSVWVCCVHASVDVFQVLADKQSYTEATGEDRVGTDTLIPTDSPSDSDQAPTGESGEVVVEFPSQSDNERQWVRYTPNPYVRLHSPAPRAANVSATPSKTPMMPLPQFSDRMISLEEVEAIKEREKNAPETLLASDEKERNARLPKGYPRVHDAAYATKCAQFHGSARTRVESYGYPVGNTTDEWGTIAAESNHAIVVLMSGDESARMGMALIQSLRNMNTCPGIDMVVALAGGGVGSEECKNSGKQNCDSATPTSPGDIISDSYIKALLKLGVRFRFVPKFQSRTASIPGGDQSFWGMAFNKLNVLGWKDYDKIMFLDADTLFFHNVDYLLFYPMYTGSMTMCCNGRDAMKPGGGLWIVEPSQNLIDLTSVYVNDHDRSQEDGYNIGLEDWHFGDMHVLAMMFAKARKQQPYLIWPESYDMRQSFKAIEQLWTGERRNDTHNWKPMDSELMLAGPWDLTTMPKNVDEKYWYRASTHDRNYYDDVADRLQLPEERGRTWHALNESYDWIAQQCSCVPAHDRGPDWFISVHLSCMTFHKPAQFKTFPEFRYASSGNEPQIPECMRYYMNLWGDLYEQAMGELKRNTWWQEKDPAITYKLI